jgi:hypothetical protein
MSETRILIRLLRIYFPRISEFGSASEFRGRGGVEPPQTPRWYATEFHSFVHLLLSVTDTEGEREKIRRESYATPFDFMISRSESREMDLTSAWWQFCGNVIAEHKINNICCFILHQINLLILTRTRWWAHCTAEPRSCVANVLNISSH